MKPKRLALAAVLLIGLQTAGCYTDYGPVEVATGPERLSTSVSRIQAGDKLKITVYGEDGLSGPYDVSPNGDISMPLVGTVRVAGRIASELGRDIAQKYRGGGFLQDPNVTVAVVEYPPVYVLGEVAAPGGYPFRSGLNVHSAIALAGGFTYRASRTDVLVRHTGEDVWREYPLTEPVPIVPGDLIRVPERYF